MSLIIPQFLFCLAGILALQHIIANAGNPDTIKKLKRAGLVAAGVIGIALMAYLSLDYLGESMTRLKGQLDNQPEQVRTPVMNAINALTKDRKAIFLQDIFKSLIIIAIFFFVVYSYARKKIKNPAWVYATAIILLLIDLLPVDNTYLNESPGGESAWSEPEESKQELVMGKADQQILADTSWYRVLNLAVSPFQDASTSYFHKSIGGYHAAKIGRYQDLWENKVSPEVELFRSDTTAQRIGLDQTTYTGLNMLNTKYIIGYNPPATSGERPLVIKNPNALGPAWFVREVRFAKNLKDEMNSLLGLDASKTAIVPEDQKSKITQPVYDSAAQIQLVKNDNNVITYRSSATTNQFAVFSEVYYSEGWNAYIDGKKGDYVKTNYALRGLSIPAGNHMIEFKFEPASYKRGRTLTSIGQILVLLLLLTGIFVEWKRRRRLGD